MCLDKKVSHFRNKMAAIFVVSHMYRYNLQCFQYETKMTASWRHTKNDVTLLSAHIPGFSTLCIAYTFEPQPIKAEVTDKHTICCQYQKALVG